MYFSYLQGLLQVKIEYHEQITMQTQHHVRKGEKHFEVTYQNYVFSAVLTHRKISFSLVYKLQYSSIAKFILLDT